MVSTWGICNTPRRVWSRKTFSGSQKCRQAYFFITASTFLAILHQHFWRFWFCRKVSGRSWLRGESNSSQEIAEKLQQIIEDDISKLTQVSTLKQHSGENECVDATIGILEYTKNMKELPKEYTTLLKEIRKDSPISSWLPSFSQKDTRHKFNFRVSLFTRDTRGGSRMKIRGAGWGRAQVKIHGAGQKSV